MIGGRSAVFLAIGLVTALALAGTPCPNPKQAEATDAFCAYSPEGELPGDGGWWLSPAGGGRHGGCVTPGTNSKECVVKNDGQVNFKKATLGTRRQNRFGYFVYSSCDVNTEGTATGLRYGTNSDRPCDYGRCGPGSSGSGSD